MKNISKIKKMSYKTKPSRLKVYKALLEDVERVTMDIDWGEGFICHKLYIVVYGELAFKELNAFSYQDAMLDLFPEFHIAFSKYKRDNILEDSTRPKALRMAIKLCEK